MIINRLYWCSYKWYNSSFFEDSVFYKIIFYTGGPFKFGKNKGCKFLDKNCNLTDFIFKDDFYNSSGILKYSHSRINKGHYIIYNYTLNDIKIDDEYQYFEDHGIGGLKQINYCPVTDNDEGKHFILIIHKIVIWAKN